MTLTGTTDNTQAVTCEDFVSQFWPTSGSLLLKAIEQFLTPVESSTEMDKHERSSRLSEGSTIIKLRSVVESVKGLATEGVIETRITVDTSCGTNLTWPDHLPGSSLQFVPLKTKHLRNQRFSWSLQTYYQMKPTRAMVSLWSHLRTQMGAL